MRKAVNLLSLILAAAISHAQTTPKTDSTSAGGVFRYVDEMPECSVNVNDFLSENLKYPRSARKRGVEGRVVVLFIVTENGEVKSAKAVQGFDEECDAEAVRVIAILPKWKPGKQNGKPVNVYYTIPINFKLEDDTQPKSMGTRRKKGLTR